MNNKFMSKFLSTEFMKHFLTFRNDNSECKNQFEPMIG